MAKRRLNGDGSIYQRTDGLWVGRVSIDGKLRQVSARTQTLASQKLQKLKQSPFDASTQTLGEFLADWLEEVCRPTLKPRTYASYADLVRLHIAPDLGHVKLAKLSAQHVQTWRNKKLASGRAPRTVLHMYAVLRTALNRAVKYELVQRNVALLVDPPTVKPADIHPLTPDQAQGLLEVVQGQRFEHLYALLVSTGLRLGEAQALRWSDVDLEHNRVRVRHTMLMQPRQPWVLTEPKSDRSRRLVPLIGQAKAALIAQKDRQVFEMSAAGNKYTDHDLVFAQPDGEPVTASAVEHDFKRALTAAGLPRRHRPHDLRHSAATYLLAAGVPERIVMDFLGHSNLATTRHYEHVMDSMLAGAGDKLEAFLGSHQAAV